MEPLQLTDLPWSDVIFKHIFSLLSLVDLCRLRGVSKGFQQMVVDYLAYYCGELDVCGYLMSNEDFQKVSTNISGNYNTAGI